VRELAFDWRSLGARVWRRLDAHSLALLVILVIAVGLRAYNLNGQSLWIDEMDEGTTARISLDQFLPHIRFDFGAAPLDYVAQKIVLTVLGQHGTVATRLWAFSVGCFGVWLIYRLARSLFEDRLVALIAAFMLTFSAFQIYYSDEARFYAFALAAGMVQLIAFLHALNQRSLRAWLLATLATCAALYTHYFLAALLPVEGIYVVGECLWRLRRDHPDRLTVWQAARQVGLAAASQAVAFATLLPWLMYALPHQVQGGYALEQQLTWERAYQMFVVLVGLAPIGSMKPLSPGQVHLASAVLGLAAIGLLGGLKARNPRVLILAMILVVAIPVAWTSDQIGHYFWSERQVIFLLAPLYVLAAAGARVLLVWSGRAVAAVLRRGWLSVTVRDVGERTEGVMAGLTLGLAAFWAVAFWGPIDQVYANRWIVKEDWRSASAAALAGACTDTQFWSFVDDHYSYGIGYYDDGLLARSHFLAVLPDGHFVGDLSQDLRLQPIGQDDWIISQPTRRTPSGVTEDALLRRQGWKPTYFQDLTLYTRVTCPHPA
jgi:hypothetical protein